MSRVSSTSLSVSDVSMPTATPGDLAGLLVLADYVGELNDLTLVGWDDVMPHRVSAAAQMFTPLPGGTFSDDKLRGAGGSKITWLFELMNLTQEQTAKCLGLVGMTQKVQLEGDSGSVFMTFVPNAKMPLLQPGQSLLLVTDLPTEYSHKNEVVVSAKRCFQAVVGEYDSHSQSLSSKKEKDTAKQDRKRLRHAMQQLDAVMGGDAAAGQPGPHVMPVFRNIQSVLQDHATSRWCSFEVWALEHPQAMTGKLNPAMMCDVTLGDSLLLVVKYLQYLMNFARPYQNAEPRAATLQQVKKSGKNSTTSSLLLSGQARPKAASFFGDNRAIIWVIDYDLLEYLVQAAPLSVFKHLRHYGTEHCIASDNKGMRITIEPRLREVKVLGPHNDIITALVSDEGGQRFMTLTGETLHEYAFLYAQFQRVAKSLSQTPADAAAMETATPALAEDSSDQNFQVAKKWIGIQMADNDDERRQVLMFLGTKERRRKEFKEFASSICQWTPTDAQCALMVDLDSICMLISQIAGAGKSDFLVAAAAWMEYLANERLDQEALHTGQEHLGPVASSPHEEPVEHLAGEQLEPHEEAVEWLSDEQLEPEGTLTGQEHLGAVASSTHEKPVFFVCSPSNKQTDELEAKFKIVFGDAKVQRMGIDGDENWPRNYFEDLLTSAMTDARSSIGYRVLVLADRVIDMLLNIHDICSRNDYPDDDVIPIEAAEALIKYLLRSRHQHLQGIWDGLEQAQREAVQKKSVFIGTSAQILKLFSGISEHAYHFDDVFNTKILMADEIQLLNAFMLYALSLSAKLLLGCCDPRQAPNANQNINFGNLFEQSTNQNTVIAIVRHSWCCCCCS